jgi:hypothetical protein
MDDRQRTEKQDIKSKDPDRDPAQPNHHFSLACKN